MDLEQELMSAEEMATQQRMDTALEQALTPFLDEGVEAAAILQALAVMAARTLFLTAVEDRRDEALEYFTSVLAMVYQQVIDQAGAAYQVQ